MTAAWTDYFQPGEHLLWEGRPERGIPNWPAYTFFSLFGSPFLLAGLTATGVGIGALTGHVTEGEGPSIMMIPLGLVFVVVGGGLVFGPWYAGATAHRKIRYAVSDRCAYVARTYWRRTLEVYPILASTPVVLEKGRAGDTVYVHVRKERDSDGESTTRVGFENIADGETVYRLIRRIQDGMRG
jgi:hypothetical protein